MRRLSKIEHFFRPGVRSKIAMNKTRSLNDAFVVIKRELLWATDRLEVKPALQPFVLVRDPRSLSA